MKDYINSLLDPVALIGIVASVIVLVSMCFNTQTKKGNIWMRVLNFIGSIVSVVYGVMLGPSGIGVILINGILVFVNIYYLINTRNDNE